MSRIRRVPVFRSHSVVEFVRGVKAFITLDAGLTRGQPREDLLRERLEALTGRLQRSEERAERRREQLEKARRRANSLQRRLRRAEDRESREVRESVERTPEQVVDDFHRLYYDSSRSGGTWHDTFWQGIPTWKCPLDLWVYQEIIFDQRPDVIVETGTAFGGSALFLSTMCDLVGNGRVITVDVEHRDGRPEHERLSYLLGSSTAPENVQQIEGAVPENGSVLVILDSDHSERHVLEELRTYSRFVAEGGYLIVEDTNVNGHPVRPDFGPGPMEAVDAFLQENGDFAVDPGKEKFYMTFNPRGFLKRASGGEA